MLKYVIVAFLISACSTSMVSNSKTIKKKVNIPKTTLLKVEYDCPGGLITHDVFLKRTNYEGCKSTKVSFTDGKSISFKNFVDNGNMFTSFHSAFDNFIVMNKDFYEGGGHIVINPTGSHELFSVQSRGTINISPDKKKILFVAEEDDFYVPDLTLFSRTLS